MMEKEYVYVIQCSGIGKSLGTIGRKATYKVVEELRPKQARTICLALLTIGDKEALEAITEHRCLSIDGCPAKCAQKNIEAQKGKLVKSFMVTDFLRKNRGLKPEGVITLNPDGVELANRLAEEVAEAIGEVMDG